MNNQLKEKKLAGEAAASYVKDGMIVGLGTGSTVRFATEKIAERMKKEGLQIQGVPTSQATKELAKALNIPLISLDEMEDIDITIDGADEVDGKLNGIKGGGGALLFEKIVASASKRNVWVVGGGKKVKTLGTFPLPVEVVPFACPVVLRRLRTEGVEALVRMSGNEPFITDSGNWIIDLHLRKIEDPKSLETQLNLLPGVVENGLFLNRADTVIVAEGEGVKEYNRT